jgi:hypothetical protein
VTLAILPSLDLVVSKTVKVLTVVGTTSSNTKTTLGTSGYSETQITTSTLASSGNYRSLTTPTQYLADTQTVLLLQELRVITNNNVGLYRTNSTSSLYLSGTQQITGPRETVINTTSNVGVAQKNTVPSLAAILVPTQTKFVYGNQLLSRTDVSFQTPNVKVNNQTLQFSGKQTISGIIPDVILTSRLDNFNITSLNGNVFYNNQNYNYGSISSTVTAYSNQLYDTPGTYTFTVPAGVTQLTMLAVGGGGGGSQNTTSPSGGGGGTLVFYNNVAVTPGETFTVVVGAGGTSGASFGNSGGYSSITRVTDGNLLLNATGGSGGNGLYWTDAINSVSVYDTPVSPIFAQFVAVSPSRETISFSATGLPNGVVLNSATGVLGGDPDTVVSTTAYNLAIIASTATQSITRPFTLFVAPTPPSVLTISPAISGKTTWNLVTDGNLTVNTAATTYTVTPTYTNVSANLKLWGAGGGSAANNGSGGGNGGSGGYAAGIFTFVYGVNYQIIVGSGGAGTSSGRTAAAGGAGTGMQFAANTTPIIVAGGGGGGGGGGTGGTAGGGSTGQGQFTGGDAPSGAPGTQSGPGAGGSGGRRTGASGSGRNGGSGSTGSAATTGGTGFGNGGAGAYNGGDAGSGGGGGGYYGGGEGGGNLGGAGGGGGSGYTHPTLITSASLLAGTADVPPNSSDSIRGTNGNGGTASSAGSNGIFIIIK